MGDVQVLENWQSLTASFVDGSCLVARTAPDTIVVYITRVTRSLFLYKKSLDIG